MYLQNIFDEGELKESATAENSQEFDLKAELLVQLKHCTRSVKIAQAVLTDIAFTIGSYFDTFIGSDFDIIASPFL